MLSFSGSTALVTGSSRGIGRQTAILLAEQGVDVGVNYLESEDQAKKTVEKIESHNQDGIAIQADVANKTDVQAMVETIREEFGPIDYLVNNAGIIERPSHWRDISDEDWQRTLQVNLKGVFNGIRQVAPAMESRGEGGIVNVTSTYAMMGAAPVFAYTAAKAGVINLTRSLAPELAPEVNLNAVAFGNMDTDMTAGADDAVIESIIQETPKNRLGTRQEAAESIAYLLSDNADFIVGEIITVDGGHKL